MVDTEQIKIRIVILIAGFHRMSYDSAVIVSNECFVIITRGYF